MRNTNEMEIRFDGKSANEGFARVAVAPFLTQLNPSGGGGGGGQNTAFLGGGQRNNPPGEDEGR